MARPDYLTDELRKLGFYAPVEDADAHRIVASTVASEKAGKTHLACTFPDPIAFISTDTGTREVAEKFAKSKRIIINNFNVPEKPSAADQDEYKEEWARMKLIFKTIVKSKHIRTLAWDTATEGWELCRLAAFGKLTQVMPQQYGPVNAEFRDMIKSAYARPDLNAVYIHKVKKTYKQNSKGVDSWTGGWERAGMNDVPYLVDVNLLQSVDKDAPVEDGMRRVKIKIVDCRFNVECWGTELRGDECSFNWIAAAALPNVADSYWE